MSKSRRKRDSQRPDLGPNLGPQTGRNRLPNRSKSARNFEPKFERPPEIDKSFGEKKLLLATDAMTYYPDPNKPFRVYTDASDYQLGACIMQEHNGKWRPVAYYSRKLTRAQKNYTAMEKELSAIVATFKEFRSMLLGADLTVFTDHENLTCENLQTQRVLR